MLAPLGVDVVELSGGSYEAPATTGQAGDERTRACEAYFLSLAEDLARTSAPPLMLTVESSVVPSPRRCSPVASIWSEWAVRWRSTPTFTASGARVPTPSLTRPDDDQGQGPGFGRRLGPGAGSATARLAGVGQRGPGVNPTLVYAREAVRG